MKREGLALAPATRADCANTARPCLRLACRHHLAVHIAADGGLMIIGGTHLTGDTDAELEAFTDELLERVAAVGSCTLDVVDRNPSGATLQEVATLLGVTREQIRQIERVGLIALGPRVRRRVTRSLDGEL